MPALIGMRSLSSGVPGLPTLRVREDAVAAVEPAVRAPDEAC